MIHIKSQRSPKKTQTHSALEISAHGRPIRPSTESKLPSALVCDWW